MASPWIAALRSVALNVPDLTVAENFYTRIWHLDVAARRDGALYLRGTGSDAYLLALHAGGAHNRGYALGLGLDDHVGQSFKP